MNIASNGIFGFKSHVKPHSCIIEKPVPGDSGDAKFEGIVHFFNYAPVYLFNRYINGTTDSQHDEWGGPNTLINYSIKNMEKKDQYVSIYEVEYPNITFHFKYPVYITNYTLRTRTISPDEHYPTDWELSISPDGKKYTLLDKRESISDLIGTGNSILLECQTPSKGNHVKLMMTEKSTKSPTKNDQGWWFHLSRVEFFGRIYLQEGDDFCPVHSVFIHCPCSILFTAFIGFIGK